MCDELNGFDKKKLTSIIKHRDHTAIREYISMDCVSDNSDDILNIRMTENRVAHHSRCKKLSGQLAEILITEELSLTERQTLYLYLKWLAHDNMCDDGIVILVGKLLRNKKYEWLYEVFQSVEDSEFFFIRVSNIYCVFL